MDVTGVSGTSAIRVEVVPPIAWIVLDNAEHGNPIDRRFIDEIENAWKNLAVNPDLRAVGVRSTGPSFSVGVQTYDGRPRGSIGPRAFGNWLPVLVELRGDIAAGAFELLGQADVIVSAPDVLLTVPADPASRLDVQYLRPKVPEPELRRLALIGAAHPMTADRAAQLRLIDAIVPRQHLRRHSIKTLNELAGGSH